MRIQYKSDIDGGIYVFEKRHTSLCICHDCEYEDS